MNRSATLFDTGIETDRAVTFDRPATANRARALTKFHGVSAMHTPPSCTIRLKDGRDLAYQCWGDAQGRPLHFFHGFPGSRHQAALVHAASCKAGVCVVAADRPGMGRSTAAPARRILDWPNDVEELADHLGHSRFGVIGVSCGGPYALACALRLGHRIDYVGLLAGIGPMNVPSIREHQLPVLRVLFAIARWMPAMLAPLLHLDRWMLRSNPERAVRALAGMLELPDQQFLANHPESIPGFVRSLSEAYRQGIAGPLQEARLIATDHGYLLSQIHADVHGYFAGKDRHVPPAMSAYLTEHIPNCSHRIYPDEGHLSIVKNRFADCLADFMRLTTTAGPSVAGLPY